jgi:predicted GNAT family acetyltransferase
VFSFPNRLSPPVDTVLVTDANSHLLTPLLEPWIPDTRTGQPMFVVVVDGHAVSVCCTVRRTADAHEAGVETVPAFRGRGYAARAVASWSGAVRDMGQVPLYSTAWQNDASRAVARALGLIQFGNDLHIT